MLTILDGVMREPVISQVKSAGTLVVSEGVPIIMSSVLSILSFRKLELSYAFISCMQIEIWSIWVDREDLQDVYI